MVRSQLYIENNFDCFFFFSRSVKKYSQAAVNRKRKFAKAPAPKELRLLDFISRKRLRKGAGAIKPVCIYNFFC